MAPARGFHPGECARPRAQKCAKEGELGNNPAQPGTRPFLRPRTGALQFRHAQTNRLLEWVLVLTLLGPGIGCKEQAITTGQSTVASGEVLLINLVGEEVAAFRPADARATVFLFVNAECPISNRYAPELRRLHAAFASRGVVFRRVYPGTDASAESISKHTREFDLPGEALRDPKSRFAAKAGARVTPEAAVFLPDGQLVYHGRIDDRFKDLNVERPTPTRRDLSEALEEILAGKPVSVPETKAVGCVIQRSR